MITKTNRSAVIAKKHYRLRGHLKGTAQRPRLSVFRSNKHMYAQIIDDIGKKAVDQGINEVVFDRGGFVYTGKIKALADAAREAGLTF